MLYLVPLCRKYFHEVSKTAVTSLVNNIKSVMGKS